MWLQTAVTTETRTWVFAVLHFPWPSEVCWLIGWRCLVYVCKRTVHGRVLMCDCFRVPFAFLFDCLDLYLCGLYQYYVGYCFFEVYLIQRTLCELAVICVIGCHFIHKFVFILRYCHKSCKEWPLALSGLSVHPSTWNILHLTGWFFLKLYIWDF